MMYQTCIQSNGSRIYLFFFSHLPCRPLPLTPPHYHTLINCPFLTAIMMTFCKTPNWQQPCVKAQRKLIRLLKIVSLQSKSDAILKRHSCIYWHAYDRRFMRGEINRDEYGRYITSLYFVYEYVFILSDGVMHTCISLTCVVICRTLERLLEKHKDTPAIKAIYFPYELVRSKSLLQGTQRKCFHFYKENSLFFIYRFGILLWQGQIVPSNRPINNDTCCKTIC